MANTALWLAATPAQAVVKGTASSLGAYTVRLTGGYYCSGAVIARQLVVTAAHCAGRHMRVQTGSGSVGTAGVSRSARLDDGRMVQVRGDAAILRLSSPLSGVSAAPVGDGGGEIFTIAGYGTTDERWRGSFGALHEASLVAAERFALVDPARTGSIGASACFGDSGGPVMRGSQLVGVITRAAHPSPRIACGHLTRWAPVTVSGEPAAIEVAAAPVSEPPRQRRRARHAPIKPGVQVSETPVSGFFGLFAAPPDGKAVRRWSRRKTAAR